MSYLGYGLAQGEGFIVITGEVGAGKSTLVAHLMATIDLSRQTVAQVVTSALNGEELVHIAAQAFGLPVHGHDKAAALGAIEAFLHAEARAGRRCLLIVDESQNLSIGALEELRMLSNFQLGSHPLLQTLLLGQPEFRETLLEHPKLEQLRQRVIATHHLEAMAPEEVQPYIEHRLKCVGWTGNPAFAPAIFAKLHKASGGVPRRINQIVHRLLLLGAVDQAPRLDDAMLSQVLAELTRDGTLPARPQKSEPQLANTSPADTVHLARIENALAERDAQIAELQQAVAKLASAAETYIAPKAVHDAQREAQLHERIDLLEGRLIEQDRTIRHTLTMLIEWIEADAGPRAVA